MLAALSLEDEMAASTSEEVGQPALHLGWIRNSRIAKEEKSM
jgi:hypothetical protein